MFATDFALIIATMDEADVEIHGPVNNYLDVTFIFNRAVEEDKRTLAVNRAYAYDLAHGYVAPGMADAGGN